MAPQNREQRKKTTTNPVQLTQATVATSARKATSRPPHTRRHTHAATHTPAYTYTRASGVGVFVRCPGGLFDFVLVTHTQGAPHTPTHKTKSASI